MTIVNAGHGNGRGRRVKFTSEVIEKIKELVAQGTSRQDVATLLEVPLGSLQVTCSRHGISLRQKPNGTLPHKLNGNGKSVEKTSIAIRLQRRDEAVTIDIPINDDAMTALALEAMWHDVGIGKLVGRIMTVVIDRNMIVELLSAAAASSRCQP